MAPSWQLLFFFLLNVLTSTVVCPDDCCRRRPLNEEGCELRSAYLYSGRLHVRKNRGNVYEVNISTHNLVPSGTYVVVDNWIPRDRLCFAAKFNVREYKNIEHYFCLLNETTLS